MTILVILNSLTCEMIPIQQPKIICGVGSAHAIVESHISYVGLQLILFEPLGYLNYEPSMVALLYWPPILERYHT